MLPNAQNAPLRDGEPGAGGQSFPGKLARLLIVLGGILLGQVVLYGPSLAGRKILLPLDILAAPGVYLPPATNGPSIEPRNLFLTDMLYLYEPARRFAVSEIHAGRLPMWEPYDYAGVPFIWPKFSPILALQFCLASPLVLAWTPVLGALIAGLGAYTFFRRVLAVGFWPATICAWCYPLTAFFIFWQGYPTGLAVYWLPWLLVSVDSTVRGQGVLALAGLSVVTWLTLVSGQVDVAAQVVLASGLFALWSTYDAYAGRWSQRQVKRVVLMLVGGWVLGFLLAAPYILPVVEYSQTSARMAHRSSGFEDRPPGGLAALPQTVLPDMYGGRQTGSLRLTDDNETESSAATYSGLLAALVVAPLAWCSARHRRINVFWALLSFLGLAWCLNVPGLVHLLRLPGLNMVSHNRFVFVTSFSILAMAAIGLEVLRHGPIRWRWWLSVPPALLAGLGAWCIYRTAFLPEPVDTQLGAAVLQGKSVVWVHDLQGVQQVQSWFAWHYGAAAVLCGLGLAGWWLLWSGRAWRLRLLRVIAAAMLADLLWFGYGRNVQCDPALYFPALPVLREVANAAPGRIIAHNCLPANLGAMSGLSDIRGYDGIDPARMTELLLSVADPTSAVFPYAQVQWLMPRGAFAPDGALLLPPAFDMLGVRYVIFRGSPPPHARPAFTGPDYWVMVNSNALERVFVPRRVETVVDGKERLAKLSAADFEPREVAYVEAPVGVPGACRGTARVVEEIPTRVVVSFQMETPGLVVLADRWDVGWRAYLNGQRVPILPANHAVRGVVVPAGNGTLEFRYEPASFALGLWLAGMAVVLLLAWTGIAALKTRRGRQSPGQPVDQGVRG
jgi:hypothetical protein